MDEPFELALRRLIVLDRPGSADEAHEAPLHPATMPVWEPARHDTRVPALAR